MKHLIRNYLINLTAIMATTQIMPGLAYSGGFKTLMIAAFALMLVNLAVVPLLKIVFLPLNLLTLGIFAWVINVVALYVLTTIIPDLRLVPFDFNGFDWNGFIIPGFAFNVLQVAVISSLLLGFISHFLQWLVK